MFFAELTCEFGIGFFGKSEPVVSSEKSLKKVLETGGILIASDKYTGHRAGEILDTDQETERKNES